MKLTSALFTFFLFTHSSFAAATVCVAHRGNSSEALENSMEAIRSAYRIGAEAFEFDIQHTSNGVGIVMHDSTLERTARSKPGRRCPLSRKIGTLEFDRISKNCELKNGEEILTVKKLLSTIEDWDIAAFAEFKDSPSRETIQLFYDTYSESPTYLKVISFRLEALRKLSSSRLGRLRRQGTTFFHLSRSRQGVSLRYKGIGLKNPTSSQIREATEENKVLLAWTIDKTSQLRRYISSNVPFIGTNYPEKCLRLLSE